MSTPETPDVPGNGGDQQPAAPQPPAAQPPAAPEPPAAPQQPAFGAPAAPAAPAAPQAPQQPAAPQYAAPQQPQYAAPQQPGFGQPQQPQQPGFGQPQYAPPVQGQYAMGPGGEPGPGEPFDGASSPEDLSRPLYGATFGQAVRRFFRSYAKFDGRASRSEYWWVALFSALIGLVPGLLILIGFVMVGAGAAAASDSYSATGSAAAGFGALLLVLGWILAVAISLALLVPNLAISWRRLHDGNYAGPFFFLSFIPSVGSIIILVLMVMPSRPEGRRFASSVRA